MKLFRKFSAWVLVGSGLMFALAGCGSSQEEENIIQVEEGTSANSSAPNPSNIQPDIQINVPPPSEKSQTTPLQEAAQKFFEKKQVYDGFSQGLKDRVLQNYAVSPDKALPTLFGNTTPTLYLMEGKMGVGCDPKSTFLCLDSPEDGYETVQPGVDVIGKLDLTQLAVFSATDPVAVISVFNNLGGSSSEVLVMPEDVEAVTDPSLPDTGKFSAAIGLSSGGKFTIVVTAYRVVDGGAGNELVSIMVNVTRLEAPELDDSFIEAKPFPKNNLAPAGQETAPVAKGSVISADGLDIKVKLLTTPGNGIQTRFENYDKDDKLQGVVVAVPQDNGEIVGKVLLHQGENKIKIIARSKAVEDLLGDSAPPPSIMDFDVFNAGGAPRLKLIKPEKDGFVPQLGPSGQPVELQFCYTFVPGNVTGGGSAPEITDECVTGSLGFTPEVFVNGEKLTGSSNFSYDATTGIFTATLHPKFGINLYEIKAKETADGPESNASGAFAFGNMVELMKDGILATENTFSKRGLNVDVHKSLIEGDLKEMIIKFLNPEDEAKIRDLVLNTFKKTVTTPGYTCRELDKPTYNSGDTTIDFLPETFSLGSIELTTFETNGDGMLHLGARINGMHGKADLRAINGKKVTYYGEDIGFLPLNISIARLDVNLGVAFPKNEKGISVLDLRRIPEMELLNVIGDGELGSFVSVDVDRNPHAVGADYLDSQQGLIKRTFGASLEGTFLCGVEEGLNHEGSGALGKNVADLEKLTNYNKNIFRLPLKFDLLGKSISLDAAVHLLKGDIKIDGEGIHIRNVPARINPGPDGPNGLNQLATDNPEGALGMVSRWKYAGEQEAPKGITNEDHNLALQISEDVINYALSGANLSGLIDLDVDANFYSGKDTGKPITPIDRLTPDGNSLAPDMDVNQDGLKDDLDKTTPVKLQIRTNKQVPPMLTFLTADEVKALAEEEEEIANAGGGATPDPQPTGTPSPGGEAKRFFTEDGTYFRVSIAGVEIAAFRQEAIPASAGGIYQFCKVTWADDPSIGQKGFCNLSAQAFIDAAKYPALCEGQELTTIPRLNGRTLSQAEETPENADNPTPLYRLKVGVILHGKITGVNREKSAKELLTNPEAKEKTVIHIQMAPADRAKNAFVLSMQVLENYTGETDTKVASIFDTIINGGFGSECQSLNELRIAIPDKFPGDPAPGEEPPKDLLPDFGVRALDLGATPEHLPQAFMDDSRLYIDVLAFAGLVFTNDMASASDSFTTGGN